MFDFHIHTTVSFDGRDDAEAMLAAAEQAGLAEICFTDHIDYTPEMDMVFDTAVYRAAYDNLRSDKLLIRRGMEYGLTPDNQGPQSRGPHGYVLPRRSWQIPLIRWTCRA